MPSIVSLDRDLQELILQLIADTACLRWIYRWCGGSAALLLTLLRCALGAEPCPVLSVRGSVLTDTTRHSLLARTAGKVATL